MGLIGGLDVGTTGCKLTLYTVDGNYVDSAYKEYNVVRNQGQHEIAPDIIVESVFQVIKICAQKHKNIIGIGVTSFGESFVMLDENDTPLHPILLYTDPRGSEECTLLVKEFGEKSITELVGVKPHSMYSLPKIIWIKNNLPEIYHKTTKILLIVDYIVYLLTGKAQIDYSLASRTMAFDIRNKCFCENLLQAIGIDPKLFAKPVPTGTIAGKILPSVADNLHLSTDTIIITGCHDQIASAIGAGALEVGEAVDGSGTVECITPIFDSPVTNDTFYNMGYPSVPFGNDGQYVSYMVSFTGGAVLKWYRDNFAKHLNENVYETLDKEISDAPTGILAMPHFAGAGNPYMDNGSKAALIGLTLEHTAADIYKALMEGVAYEMRLNLECMRSNGVEPRLLYATGGGSKSDKWLQIKADILGLPIVPISAKEVGAQGMCMMVAVAMGYYQNLAEARQKFVKFGRTFSPDKERSALYNRYYKAYEKTYESVRPLVEKIGE